MKRLVFAVVAAAFAVATARSQAEPVNASTTVAAAPAAAVFDTFHDVPTGFVFVRLPQGWRFVGQDAQALSHPVFHDEATGFTYVKLNRRWQFAGVAADTPMAPQGTRAIVASR